MAQIKVHELRRKSKADLQTQLKELKSELSLLRVAKVPHQGLQDREKKREKCFPMRKYSIKA